MKQEYGIICADTLQKLGEEVNKVLDCGWRVVGGVAGVQYAPGVVQWVQAVYRETLLGC